ncbi:hypothetical protein [Georgenia sp. SUBG003]|uniref:hypothetical protein n=1 Tax=Georgenia sp. SUBG003 TaxID=1497974 RepID=UPI0004D95C34|nr:hypothetical protein DA06_08720 [Georgenia sp. SUBG003]
MMIVGGPVESRSSGTAPEELLARLRTTHHELVTAPVVTEPLLMARNVAVVQALEGGVPAHLVQEVTRMGPAALELAVARGMYHRDHATSRHAYVGAREG